MLNKIENKINDIDNLDNNCEIKLSDNINNNENKDEIVSLNQLENNLT